MSSTALTRADAPGSLNAGQYLSERVQDQIAWYEKKSAWNQRWFKRLRIIEILAAALIPFLTAVPDPPNMRLVIGGLGVVITVVAGILALFQFQERWTEYRATSESLKKERFLFLTGAEPYADANAFPVFVQRVETLLANENTGWTQSLTKPDRNSGKTT